jgi:hypothetical protein
MPCSVFPIQSGAGMIGSDGFKNLPLLNKDMKVENYQIIA